MSKQTPLEYMLSVMRDASAENTRRDRMAIEALPYCHDQIKAKRKAVGYVSKKAEAHKAAKSASDGTEWAEDLRMLRGRNGQTA